MKKVLAVIASALLVVVGMGSAQAATPGQLQASVWAPTTIKASSVSSKAIAFPIVNDGGKMQISPCWRGKSEYLAGGLTLKWTGSANAKLVIRQTYPAPATKPITLTQERFTQSGNQFNFSCPKISNGAGVATSTVSTSPAAANVWWVKFSAADKAFLSNGARFSVEIDDASGHFLYQRYLNVPKLEDAALGRTWACIATVAVGSVYMISSSAFKIGTAAVGAYATITGNELADKAAKGFAYVGVMIDAPTQLGNNPVARVFSVVRKDGGKLTTEELRLAGLVNQVLEDSKAAATQTVLDEIKKKFPATKYIDALASAKETAQSAVDAFDSAVAGNTWALKQMNTTCDW
jgi:hypothetical protein